MSPVAELADGVPESNRQPLQLTMTVSRKERPFIEVKGCHAATISLQLAELTLLSSINFLS